MCLVFVYGKKLMMQEEHLKLQIVQMTQIKNTIRL